MSLFDNERVTTHEDWKDSVDARLSYMAKEIEALRLELRHTVTVVRNIKIDIQRNIENR